MYLLRVRVVSRSFAEALTHILTFVAPPAPAEQNLGICIRRPCRGKTFGGMFGAMAQTASARPATPSNGSKTTFARDLTVFLNYLSTRNVETFEGEDATPSTQITKFAIYLA
jgi:hypothetical protein